MNIWEQIFNVAGREKRTENGAVAFDSLSSDLLTLFGQIGAMRNRNDEEIIELFEKAYKEDADYAVKMLFYAGDIRGGLGERHTFRVILNWLANEDPDLVSLNLMNIPKYNRWDSLYFLIKTPVENAMWEYVKHQLAKDLTNMLLEKPVSLLAKWLKSANSHNKTTAALGKYTAEKLGLSQKMYRLALSSLRRYLDVVERKMSKKEFEKIIYSKVPAKAMLIYRNAFRKNDEDRFDQYIYDVAEGKEKINSSVLYPYDIIGKYIDCTYFGFMKSKEPDEVLELQWKSLPDYLEGQAANILCMCDVSGSMYGRPITSSLGLSIYFAQRNQGVFHNKFMTFSSNPTFFSINDNESLFKTLDRINEKCEVGYSTNLESAFKYLLHNAIEWNVKPNEMPKALIIISDMEIDKYRRMGLDFMSSMEQRYSEEGFELPKLIFFQVEARHSTFLTLNEKAIFVSGNSAASFKFVIDGINLSAFEMMKQTLDNERYDEVILPSDIY